MYTEILQNFTEENLPELDEVVMGALDLLAHSELPDINYHTFKRPLVVGSGNAAVTGQILFSDVDAVFADESSYREKLENYSEIDGVFLISASGSKHAVAIAKEITADELEAVLLTCNPEAPAKEYVSPENYFVFPKNREPYTYNTSTYMAMILSKTKENPKELLTYVHNEVAKAIPDNLAQYGAIYLLVPEQFAAMRQMLVTKFDELFGPQLMGRVYTFEQTKHAKTVIPHESELFVSFGEENTVFGKPENRLTVPLAAGAGPVAFMAASYYFIGVLQKQFPAYYKARIGEYVKETSDVFGTDIKVIVE